MTLNLSWFASVLQRSFKAGEFADLHYFVDISSDEILSNIYEVFGEKNAEVASLFEILSYLEEIGK